MRINPMPVYVKGQKRKTRMSKKANAEEKRHMAMVAKLKCVVGPSGCDYNGRGSHVHHALTGAGRNKDHMKVLPLCENHHTGKDGIHTLSRNIWGKIHGSEMVLLLRVERRLERMEHEQSIL